MLHKPRMAGSVKLQRGIEGGGERQDWAGHDLKADDGTDFAKLPPCALRTLDRPVHKPSFLEHSQAVSCDAAKIPVQHPSSY